MAIDNMDFIELLIGADAHIKAVDENGDTALILAARNPLEDYTFPNDLHSSLLQV